MAYVPHSSFKFILTGELLNLQLAQIFILEKEGQFPRNSVSVKYPTVRGSNMSL